MELAADYGNALRAVAAQMECSLRQKLVPYNMWAGPGEAAQEVCRTIMRPKQICSAALGRALSLACTRPAASRRAEHGPPPMEARGRRDAHPQGNSAWEHHQASGSS